MLVARWCVVRVVAVVAVVPLLAASSHGGVQTTRVATVTGRNPDACATGYSAWGAGPVVSADGVIVVGAARLCIRASADGGRHYGAELRLPVPPTEPTGEWPDTRPPAVVSSSGNGIIDVFLRDGMLYRSLDSGRSFAAPVAVPGRGWITQRTEEPSIATSPTGVIAAFVPGMGLTVSEDGGAHWRAFLAEAGGPGLWLDGDRLLVCGITSPIAGPTCKRSPDRGQTFGPALTQPEGRLARGRMPDEVWVWSEKGVLRSADGGDTWTAGSVPAGVTVRSFTAAPGQSTLWLTTANRELFRSVDGDSWVPVPGPRDMIAPFAESLDVGAFRDGTIALTAGPYGTTWQSADDGVTWAAPVHPNGYFGAPVDHVRLVRAANRLIAFWSETNEGNGPIYAKVSGDLGRTWSVANLVNDTERALFNQFEVATLADGAVVAMWPTATGQRASTSPDGLYWPPSVPVAAWPGLVPYDGTRSAGRIETYESANLVVDAAGRLMATDRKVTSRSLDRGQTWSPPTPIGPGIETVGSPVAVGDTVVFPLLNGVVSKWSSVALSADAGNTWDFAIVPPWDTWGVQLLAEHERLFSAWREYHGGHTWSDHLSVSDDHGRTWSSVDPPIFQPRLLAADVAGTLYCWVSQGGEYGIGARLQDGRIVRLTQSLRSPMDVRSPMDLVVLSPFNLAIIYASNFDGRDSSVDVALLNADGATLWHRSPWSEWAPFAASVSPGVRDYPDQWSRLDYYQVTGVPQGSVLRAVKDSPFLRFTW